MVEHLLCKQTVVGSNPVASTTRWQLEQWKEQNSGGPVLGPARSLRTR